MFTKTISLSAAYPVLDQSGSRATLTCYIRERSAEISRSRLWPAILICPGGGYAFTSDREAEPVALEFLGRGYQCFVLRYSCAPARHPLPLQEAAAALAWIRDHAETAADPQRIAVMGFSAGGHLAASLSLFWDSQPVREIAACSKTRPDALCLGYPVISSGKFAHRGSFSCLLGKEPQPELLQRLSLETRVRPDMPPAFLWHTADDSTVPVENTLLFAMALRQKQVPFALHIFPHGSHGLALATKETQPSSNTSYYQIKPDVAAWPSLCDQWLSQVWKDGNAPRD